MNSTLQVLLISSIVCTSIISASVVSKQNDVSSPSRMKRQWGGWGQNQGSQFGNNQNFRGNQRQYNCQEQGINIVGLPSSSYSCQNSGQSARMSQNQRGFQSSNAMQGPIGGLINGFMGR